jgi:hypothetical protein
MSNAVHIFIVTHRWFLRQIGNIVVLG